MVEYGYNDAPGVEYKHTTHVKAFRITGWSMIGSTVRLTGQDGESVDLAQEWLRLRVGEQWRKSVKDGYYVLYAEDGHSSWRPAGSFEAQYDAE